MYANVRRLHRERERHAGRVREVGALQFGFTKTSFSKVTSLGVI